MILKASERTNIVAFSMKWFTKRYDEGYVSVRKPLYSIKINKKKEKINKKYLDHSKT